MTIGNGGRIFISYRRQETAWPARQLYAVLAATFGAEAVFKDVNDIEPGEDFVEKITDAVASCDVLLALIGPHWLTITDADGNRRLDDPEDFVRLEVSAALSRGVRVVPILVDEARMPTTQELPPDLAPLTRRQAVKIDPEEFNTGRLVATLTTMFSDLSSGAHSTEVDDQPVPRRESDLSVFETGQQWRSRGQDQRHLDASPGGVNRRKTRQMLLAVAAVAVLIVALVSWQLWSRRPIVGGAGPTYSTSTITATGSASRSAEQTKDSVEQRLVKPVSGRAGALTLRIEQIGVSNAKTRVKVTATNRANYGVDIPLFENCQILEAGQPGLETELGVDSNPVLTVPKNGLPITETLVFSGTPTPRETTVTLACQHLFWSGPGQPESLQVKEIRLS